MGLLDFAKDIGASLFTDEKEAGEKIKSHIEKQNPGIENLQVTVKDGVATIRGAARDQAAAEKAILMIGNVRGVERVQYDIDQLVSEREQPAKAPETTGAAPAATAGNDSSTSAAQHDAPQALEVEFYEIKSGDTLSAIAKKFYGDAGKYQQLFDANREVIGDPDKIYPGQKIRIPQAASF